MSIERCWNCDGKGSVTLEPGTTDDACPVCRGKGEVAEVDAPPSYQPETP